MASVDFDPPDFTSQVSFVAKNYGSCHQTALHNWACMRYAKHVARLPNAGGKSQGRRRNFKEKGVSASNRLLRMRNNMYIYYYTCQLIATCIIIARIKLIISSLEFG